MAVRGGPGTHRCILGLQPLEDRDLLTPYASIPVVPAIDDALAARLYPVIQRGQVSGNRANVFARAGDSITFEPQFLGPLGLPSQLDGTGDGSLRGTLDYFRSGQVGAENSFTHSSRAARGGWLASDVLANLSAELSASKPAFVLVMVGTNDLPTGVPLAVYRRNLEGIVQTALAFGVVPVLSTLPDIPLYPEAQARLPEFNQTVVDVGESLGVPVWNYWRALQGLPNNGISADGVHPSLSSAGGADFSESGLLNGYNVRNLTALQTLDKLRAVLLLGQGPDLPTTGAGWVPLTDAVAVATGDATGPQVQLVDATTRRQLRAFDAFPGFRGGVRVATSDVTGDGVPDVVATPGPGGAPHVKVFDGRTGALASSFYAFDAGLLTGLSVVTGDVNGDGVADVVVVPEAGRTHVRAFTGFGQGMHSLFAFDPGFVGGARVAVTDVDGDRVGDIVAAAGVGGRGHVVVYSGRTAGLLSSFFAFGPEFGGTVSVAAGDFDGSGLGQVAVGVASGAGPHVVAYRPATGERTNSFFAYDPGFPLGVRLGTVTHNGRTDLLTLSHAAAAADVRRIDLATGQIEDRFVLYGVGFRRGAAFGG